MTAIVVCASTTGAAGLVAVLREAGLFAVTGARSAVLVEDASRALGGRALRGFAAPRVIVVSQDPVALVGEFEAAGASPVAAVRRARQRIALVFDVALKATCPVLVLSHGLACGPPEELAAVVGAFCGFAPPRCTAPASAIAPAAAPAERPRGMIALRAARDSPQARAAGTIVIGGPPRAGTSLIAAALHAAGLPLGKPLVPSTFENAPQNMLFKPSRAETWRRRLRGSWKAAAANPRYARLAWHGFDVPGLKALIADRRRDGPVWGVKRPGIGSFIRLGGFRLLERPRLIMSLRDPVAAALRITLAHGVDGKEALRIARWFLLDSLATAQGCTAPTLLVSHDAARRDARGLFDRLFAFCGLEVDVAHYDAIAGSVRRSGAAYVKDFAEPFVGEIMDMVDHELCGWIEGGQAVPVAVEIFADERLIASGPADEVLDDGRLFFKIDLPPAHVTGATRISAFVASSRAKLRNSGLTVADLRAMGA